MPGDQEQPDAGAPPPPKENSDALDAGPSLPGGTPETVPETPQSKIVDLVVQKSGIENMDPNRRWELIRLISTENINDPNAKPEENPRILKVLNDQLTDWGYRVTDIDRSTLALETTADKAAAETNELLRKANMPTEKYTSNVGVYGFETAINGNSMSYKKTVLDKIIDFFENVLRNMTDDGGSFFEALYKAPMRKKATMEEVAKNVQELGLDQYFTPVTVDGRVTEIKEDIKDVKKGAFLDDILRQRKTNPHLQKIDQREAIKVATQMVEHLHASSGRGIGELLANDVIIKINEEGEIIGTRLALPDSKYSAEVPSEKQQAMDLLDFCFSLGSAGMQEGGSKSPEKGKDIAKHYIQTVIQTYTNKIVKDHLKIFIKEGKPHFNIQAATRLGFDRVPNKVQAFEDIRAITKEILEAGIHWF